MFWTKAVTGENDERLNQQIAYAQGQQQLLTHVEPLRFDPPYSTVKNFAASEKIGQEAALKKIQRLKLRAHIASANALDRDLRAMMLSMFDLIP